MARAGEMTMESRAVRGIGAFTEFVALSTYSSRSDHVSKLLGL